MNRFSVFAVVFICGFAGLPAWAQGAEPAEAEPFAFEAAAELEGFTPQGRPAVVEGQGLVVPGFLTREGEDGIERVAVLWHVESGEVEVIDPPVDADGWAMSSFDLRGVNSQGQVCAVADASVNGVREGNWIARYFRRAEGDWVRIESAADGVVPVEDVVIGFVDISDRGEVVGHRTEHQTHRQLEPFLWSPEEGMRFYTTPNRWEFMQVNAINAEGVAVGCVVERPVNGRIRFQPVICYAPDDTMVLDSPEGFRDSRAMAINASGQVLVMAEKYGVQVTHVIHYVGVWDPDEGLTQLSIPDHHSLSVQGFSDAADVLILGRDLTADPNGAIRHKLGGWPGYLIRDGVLYHLPAHPGAVDLGTYYTAMSSQGDIVGYALIPVEGEDDATRTVGFVLSPEIELEPVEVEQEEDE